MDKNCPQIISFYESFKLRNDKADEKLTRNIHRRGDSTRVELILFIILRDSIIQTIIHLAISCLFHSVKAYT